MKLADQTEDVQAGCSELALLKGCSEEEAWELAKTAGDILRIDQVQGLIFALEAARVETRQRVTLA